MLSDKAVGKSSTETAHSLAVANLDHLFRHAICGWKKPDEKNDINIVAIHRFFAPMQTADRKMVLTKLTVKETIDRTHPHPLYTVETVDFNEKSPAAQWVGDSVKLDRIPMATRSVGDILILAETVQEYNSRKEQDMEHAERLEAAKAWMQEEAEREAETDLEQQTASDEIAGLAGVNPHYRAHVGSLSPSLLEQKREDGREAETHEAVEERIKLRKAREQREHELGRMELEAAQGKELPREDYIMPRSIAQAYTEVGDGKFYSKDKKNPQLMFEDKGSKLSTSATDSKTIADMVTLARHKQWESLKLSGSQEFRREAWLQAESQGIKTKGYTPKEADLAALEALRQERATNTIQPIRERQAERGRAAAVAPRNDLNRNQAQIHTNVMERVPENVRAMKQNPALAGKSPEALEKLAYYRGLTQEEVKDKPPAERDAALVKFDREAENPAFLERLEKSDTQARALANEREMLRETPRQERKDTLEQSR